MSASCDRVEERNERGRALAPFAWARVLSAGGSSSARWWASPYYLGPLYVMLPAAGSVIAAGVVEGSRRFFSQEEPAGRPRGSMWRSPAAAYSWVIVFAVVFLPLFQHYD